MDWGKGGSFSGKSIQIEKKRNWSNLYNTLRKRKKKTTQKKIQTIQKKGKEKAITILNIGNFTG